MIEHQDTASVTRPPFAERLREFRRVRGLARADLARELGVKVITVYRWERGASRPSPLAADRLSELGFGPMSWHDTNAGTVPRLNRSDSRVQKRAAAQVLKDGAVARLPFRDGPAVGVPMSWVRNGPPDQAAFHERMVALQVPEDARLSRSLLARRLSMVESVEGLGHTAQFALERPRPIAVSWSSNYGPHGWHRYVGRFPPHVVRALLNHFQADSSTVVCDPFGGSGTTAVECRLLGIPFIGIEICPLSCLMSRTKAGFPENGAILRDLVRDLGAFYDETWDDFVAGRAVSDLSHEEILARPGNLVPRFPNIDKWFTPEALLGVSIVVQYAMSLKGFVKDAALLALSARMRSIGNVDVDVVRAEYRRTPREEVDVRSLVASQLTKMSRDIDNSVATHKDLIGSMESVSMLEGSVLDVDLQPGSVHAVITSPPYGVEAISYLRTHLLSYRSLVAELGHDPYETRAKTIGSEYVADHTAHAPGRVANVSEGFRAFFDRPGPWEDSIQSRRSAMMQFFDDMFEVAERLARWLVADGRVAFIVGNKRLGDEVIPTDTIIREVFQANGLALYDVVGHKLKTNNSNSQVPWQERIIQEERIMLFRRMKGA